MPAKQTNMLMDHTIPKVCTQCGELKPAIAFVKYRNEVRSAKCRVCYNKNAREVYQRKHMPSRHPVASMSFDPVLYDMAMKAFRPTKLPHRIMQSHPIGE